VEEELRTLWDDVSSSPSNDTTTYHDVSLAWDHFPTNPSFELFTKQDRFDKVVGVATFETFKSFRQIFRSFLNDLIQRSFLSCF
jgi:hypothetical protein